MTTTTMTTQQDGEGGGILGPPSSATFRHCGGGGGREGGGFIPTYSRRDDAWVACAVLRTFPNTEGDIGMHEHSSTTVPVVFGSSGQETQLVLS